MQEQISDKADYSRIVFFFFYFLNIDILLTKIV